MAILNHEQFMVMADRIGLSKDSDHLDELFKDVQLMFERLQIMDSLDVDGEEPLFHVRSKNPAESIAPSRPVSEKRSLRYRSESLTDATVVELAELIRSKKCSPVEIIEAFIERTTQLEPVVNAFITRTFEQAIEAAQKAEHDIVQGYYKGPLHGIPIALKDLYWTRGVRTTSGSAITADFVPDQDATAVTKLLGAGAFSLGKTGMVEYAYGGFEHNELYGDPTNP